MGFAVAGARLAITTCSNDDLLTPPTKLADRGVLALPGSVAELDMASWLARAVVAQYGGLDVLANMASPNGMPGPAHERLRLAGIPGVNSSGTVFCCRAAARHMISNKDRGTVNVSSVHGNTGIEHTVGYGPGKGGGENLTRSLAPGAMRVKGQAAGYFRAQFAVRHQAGTSGRRVRAGIPLGRIGEREELAGAAVSLTGGAFLHVTGAVLPVEGSWTAR